MSACMHNPDSSRSAGRSLLRTKLTPYPARSGDLTVRPDSMCTQCYTHKDTTHTEICTQQTQRCAQHTHRCTQHTQRCTQHIHKDAHNTQRCTQHIQKYAHNTQMHTTHTEMCTQHTQRCTQHIQKYAHNTQMHTTHTEICTRTQHTHQSVASHTGGAVLHHQS